MSITLESGETRELNIQLTPFIPGMATLYGNVGLQGAVGSLVMLPPTEVTVRFLELGTNIEVMQASTVTDGSGNFAITGISPGTYDVCVKGYTSLSILKANQVFTEGNVTSINFGVLLEGDANDDDYITDADIALVEGDAWGTQEGDPNFNPKCDFDRDGWVTGADRNIAITNFGLHGDCVSCLEGATECRNSDLYKCINSRWQLIEENSPECMSVPVIQQFFVVTIPRGRGEDCKGKYEIHCLVKNIGHSAGTHKLTLYADGEIAREETFTIGPGETYEYVFSWGLAKCGISGTVWIVGDWGEETPHIRFTAGYSTTAEADVDCTAVTDTTAILRFVAKSVTNEWRISYDGNRITIKAGGSWTAMWCAITELLPKHTYEATISGHNYGSRSDWTEFTTR